MEHSNKPSNSGTIEISVVVPVRNEANSVRALLEGLLSQTLLPAEIVITDCGSNDATAEIIEEFISGGAPVKLIREQTGLPGHGRNIGAAGAACEWIAFTDAGNRPANDWLATLARRIADEPAIEVVYGSYEPVVDSFFKECAAIAYVPPPAKTVDGFARPCSVVSVLMRRKVWESVGGFPEHLRSAEDLLFIHKVERAGFGIARAPQAVVYWDLQPNLWQTFKRFVTYAHNNIRAGLWRQWQAAIFQRYALLAILAAPAIFFGMRWLVLPLACWFGLLVARAAKALHKNQRVYPARMGRNALRLFALVVIIATLDVAAFVGSARWLLFDKLHARGART